MYPLRVATGSAGVFISGPALVILAFVPFFVRQRIGYFPFMKIGGYIPRTRRMKLPKFCRKISWRFGRSILSMRFDANVAPFSSRNFAFIAPFAKHWDEIDRAITCWLPDLTCVECRNLGSASNLQNSARVR